jgi:hypothetical protein
MYCMQYAHYLWTERGLNMVEHKNRSVEIEIELFWGQKLELPKIDRTNLRP